MTVARSNCLASTVLLDNKLFVVGETLKFSEGTNETDHGIATVDAAVYSAH